MRSAAREHRRSARETVPGFTSFRAGRKTLYLRDSLAAHAPSILASLASLNRTPATGAGNRESGFVIKPNGCPDIFVRRSRRGGLMHFVNRDLYFGLRPRPLVELAVALEATQRGVPVAEPLGVTIESLAPGVYRGAMLTQVMAGMTLWELLRTDDDPSVRSFLIEESRRVIDRMHEAGLFHDDLNLHNLFVTRIAESFTIVILDLDKARLYSKPLNPQLRRLNLDRLARSAHKLDRTGAIFTPPILALLTR
jgi:hypothetical protein